MEYCDSGSALDTLIQLKKPFTEPQISSILYQAIQGLHYLHTMQPKIIHRDIKAGNILLNSKGEVKLADFGVATQLSDTLAKRQTQIGSPYWMSPEIIQETPYDTKVDIWSLGITEIELAQMKPPHWEAGSIRALFLIATKPPPTLSSPHLWSDDFNHFISLCVQKNPKDRPNTKELLENKFITQFKDNGVDILISLVDECFFEEEESELSTSDLSENNSYSNSINNNNNNNSNSSNNNSSTYKDIKFYSSMSKSISREDDRKLFSIKGDSIEGELLTVQGDLIQSLHNGNNDFKLVWFRIKGNGNNNNNNNSSSNSGNNEEEIIPIEVNNSKTMEYLITKEDIGNTIKCTCYSDIIPVDSVNSTSISFVTDIIRPALPQIKRIKINGGPYFTKPFKIQVDYFGGEEGDSKIEWFKSTNDGNFISINNNNTNNKTYQPTNEDVYSRIEVKYTPVRKDGEIGIPVFVVSKTILKAVGRIVIYTISGVPCCLHAKHLLTQHNVPYVEIDLLKYPNRMHEFDLLTNGKRTVPQLFFNDKHIGGLKELIQLEESGKHKQMIISTLDEEPPEIPSVPKEDELDTWNISNNNYNNIDDKNKEINYKMYTIYLQMRDSKRGINIKIRGPITKRVKTFKANELIKWLSKNVTTNEEASQIAQSLKEQTYVFRIKDNHLPFFNDQTLYSFQFDTNEGNMLNLDKIITTNNSNNNNKINGITISNDLVRQMKMIVDRYSVFNAHKRRIHFLNSVIFTNEYYQLINCTWELQTLDISKLNENEVKVFFTNIYNTLIYHINIVVCCGLVKLGNNDYLTWGKYGYIIGGQKYSLLDIEHGILRGNRKLSKRKIKVIISKADPRIKSVFNFDPRIHFVLNRFGTFSSTSIPILNPSQLDSQLQSITESVLCEEISIDRQKNIVIVPKFFAYYLKDFGKNESGLLKWISIYLKDKKKEDLEFIINHKYTLKYQEYDWDLMALDEYDSNMIDLDLHDVSRDSVRIKR